MGEKLEISEKKEKKHSHLTFNSSVENRMTSCFLLLYHFLSLPTHVTSYLSLQTSRFLWLASGYLCRLNLM